MIIRKAVLLGLYLKPSAPIPNRERLERLFLQASLIAGIASTNRDFFGPAKFVMIRHGITDVYVFPLGLTEEEKGNTILGFAITQPYNIEELIKSVSTKVDEAVIAENR